MSELVAPEDIERIVGVSRDPVLHCGRAVCTEQTVYVLHSRRCQTSGIDLRNCRYSKALDRGINPEAWVGHEDRPVELGIHDGRLYPIDDLFEEWSDDE